MCSKEATSVRRGLVNDLCLDDAPSAPSRLASPRKKKTVKFKLGSNNSGKRSIKISKRDRLLISPEGMRGILKISGELKDLLETLPSGEKEEKSALVDMKKPVKGTKLGSHRDWLDISSHSRESVESHDTIPTLPCRLLSPELQKGAIKISGQARELLVLDNLPSSHHPIVQATPTPSPVDATIWVEDTDMEFRELVLSRMPENVKNLLSKDQWYRILEQPASMDKGARGNNSVCSDVTDCDWSEQNPIEWEHEVRKTMGNDLPKKEKDDDETKETLSLSFCSASQPPSHHQTDHGVEDLQMMGSSQAHDEPCLLNEVSLLLAMDTLIF